MQSNPTEPATQTRSEFMRSLGLSSAALMAFYCMGTLTSCGGGGDPAVVTPTPTSGVTGNTQTANGAINFTLDLNNADLTMLKTEGGARKIGDAFVFNARGGSYVAVQRLCTHQAQDNLEYRLATNNIQCTAHGSLFTTAGAVQTGPAGTALKRYTATLSGNILTITG